MADLEALTRIEPTLSSGSSVMAIPGQYSWRYTLPDNKVLRLGSDPRECDWSVPEDRMISRYHATLEWNGETLLVTRRGIILPDYPNKPGNQIWFRNKPVESCHVRPGEWFVIGQTRFTLRGDTDSDPDAPVDATLVARQDERSRAELENVPFSNPTILLKALEQLPQHLKIVTTEAALFKQMLRIAVSALPKADAAAIVRIPPDCPVGDLRVTVVEQNVRNPHAGTSGEFVPSRKLVRRVICQQRKSCLHVWSTDPTDFTAGGSSDHSLTLGAMHQQGATPWAICTPFQDGSQHAIYISGRLLNRSPLDSKPDASHLTEYQKFVEILLGLLEATRRTLRLSRQIAVVKEAWPSNMRRYLDDLDNLDALLKTPQEKDVTVLFCDLRGYSGFAEQHGESLASAWQHIRQALDTMSGAITERGGIVAGFRGDAVLGFWGWPENHTDQIERAAETALRIYEKLTGTMVLHKCGIGITHGRALAGRLGAHDLAVVDLYGPVVNLAFRLEEMTKAYGVGIVISDEVANKLQVADPLSKKWRLRSLSNVRPRGMKKPLTAFELSPAQPVGPETWLTGQWYESQREQWNEAIKHFVSGNWNEAAPQFENGFPDDPAAKCFLRFIQKFHGKPPADWDGAFTPRPEE